MANRQLLLNFHGVGEVNRILEPGEADYWLSETHFCDVLNWISSSPVRSRIRITFDDGNKSDVTIGLKYLATSKQKATYFVLADKIGQDGYLDHNDLGILRDEGMEVGSHGRNHLDWRRISVADLEDEVVGSKEKLEKLIDRKVESAAIPFGSYDRRVLQMLKRAGYHAVYTSDGGPSVSNWWLRPRLSIRQDTTIKDLEAAVDVLDPMSSAARMRARMFVKSIRW